MKNKIKYNFDFPLNRNNTDFNRENRQRFTIDEIKSALTIPIWLGIILITLLGWSVFFTIKYISL